MDDLAASRRKQKPDLGLRGEVATGTPYLFTEHVLAAQEPPGQL